MLVQQHAWAHADLILIGTGKHNLLTNDSWVKECSSDVGRRET
jgi:hypothetical protein